MNCLALVIGINEYDNLSQLRSAVNDAEAVGDKLRDLKYDVTYSLDEDRFEVKRRIELFEDQIAEKKPDVALFYFAGHGCIVNRCDCLLLKDAVELRPENDARNRVRSIELNDICSKFRELGNQINIFIIDACRSNRTRGINGSSDFGKNIQLPYQTFIAYSTSPGAPAKDGETHSFYTAKLLEYIDVESLSIEHLFKIVRKNVYEAIGQLPWEHSCLIENYQFNHGQKSKYYGAKYSEEAFEDKKYNSNKLEVNEIIRLFKTQNYYRQEEALNLVKKVYKKIEINDKFVIGRNILQASVGGCWKCIEEISYTHLSVYQEGNENHILNGILYEMYFDSENKFRSNNLKGIQFLHSLSQQLKFENSVQFIRDYLSPYSERLFYMPGDKNMKTLLVKLLDMNTTDVLGNKCFQIKNILLAGADIIDKLFILEQDYCKADFHCYIAKQMGIPIELLRIKYTIPIEENDYICYNHLVDNSPFEVEE